MPNSHNPKAEMPVVETTPCKDILSLGLVDFVQNALKANDLQGALVHAENLLSAIRTRPEAYKHLEKADSINHRREISKVMSMVQRFRHAHPEDYDRVYREIQDALYSVFSRTDAPRKRDIGMAELDHFSKALDLALKESSIDKAVSFICIWECERALAQARKNDFKYWDTCFEYVIYNVKIAWMQRERNASHVLPT